MYIKCPYCRRPFFTGEGKIEITPRQRKILEAIPEAVRANRNGAASTASIAARVHWSERTVRYELSHLEHMGEVVRHGRHSGWSLVERPVVMAA